MRGRGASADTSVGATAGRRRALRTPPERVSPTAGTLSEIEFGIGNGNAYQFAVASFGYYQVAMAHLGGIPFVGGDVAFDSAAAFLLTAPPEKSVVLPFDGVEIEVRPGVAYVVARFSGAKDAESAHRVGVQIAQRGLDLTSILGKADLLTEKVSEEFLVAWDALGGKTIRIHSTTTLNFSVPPATITVRDAEGRDTTQRHPTPQHHPAFRYFRLSQTSSDLHEAFRNMYLCFELLLSSKVAVQPGERERDWLRRGLEVAHAALDLGRVVGGTQSDPIEELISRIYTATRLPLFHAKSGKEVIQPQGPDEEREKVLAALQLLTRVVLEMSKAWFGARRLGGAVFHGWVYQSLRKMYSSATILALPDVEALEPAQSDLSRDKYLKAVSLSTEMRDHPADDRAPVLLGKVDASALWDGDLMRLEIVGPDKPLLAHTLENPLSLIGFDSLQYVDAPSVVNRNQPRMRFPQ